MIRWILLFATILGFVFVFTTHSPVVLGIGLLLGIGGFFGLVLSLASDRVSANSRPDTAMASTTELAAMRKPVRPLPPRPPASTTSGPTTPPSAPR